MSPSRKVAIVTGAGTGIGRAVALALLSAGYALALAGRRQHLLEATAAQASSGQALVVPTDVTDPTAVAALFDHTAKTFGRLDLLFNNAGVMPPPTPLEELSFEQWQTALNANLTGAFLCTQQAFKHMKAQQPRGGRIINNGSISAHVPRPHSVAYTAAKHAITGLTKSTSLEGRQYDIACGQLDIGNAETELTAGIKKGSLQADGSLAPEPMMAADHVAQAVLYMASLPLDANVQFLTLLATKMPYIGRG